jgi:hypothetical protein
MGADFIIHTVDSHGGFTRWIHTVGSAWIDGSHGERDILRSCYENFLSLAETLHRKSIAFPLIATVVYGFSEGRGVEYCTCGNREFPADTRDESRLVVFDRKARKLSEQLVDGIEQYIDEHSARMLRDVEYGVPVLDMRRCITTKQTEPEEIADEALSWGHIKRVL